MLGPVEGKNSAATEDPAVASAFSELAPRLHAALTPLADPHSVDDAAAEAFLYLCAHRDEVLAMGNPGGYLYGTFRPTLPPAADPYSADRTARGPDSVIGSEAP